MRSVDIAPAESFGRLLRSGRERAGLTQRALALAAGISVAAVRDLEQHRSHRPRRETTTALADALGLAPGDAARLLDAARARPDGHPPSASGASRLSILGPLTVQRGAAVVTMASATQRSVLGLLAIQPNRPLSRDHIVDVLWREEAPRTAVNLLQTYIARLRRTLRAHGPVQPLLTIGSVPGGYRLDADAASLDVVDFRQAVTAARAAAPPVGCRLLGRALDLWRGEPLGDLECLGEYPALTGLRDEQVAAAIGYAAAADVMDRHGDVCLRLRDLLPRHPLHEPLHARYILAMAKAGDQAGALRAYDRIRSRLADELGVDPGPELLDLQIRMLRQQVTVAPGQHGGAGRSNAGPAHEDTTERPTAICQLPPDPPDYTGYDAEVADACTRLTPDPDRPVTTFAPVIVTGQGGAGKTTLAVHVAHRLRSAFPDGQVFVSLGDVRAGPVPPDDAMSRALRALRVPDAHTATDLEDKIVRYRTALDGRRILIVLDNAARAEQVRPFLPGGSGSAIVISTRTRLTTLAGAYHIELDVLDEDEAVALLQRVIGEARTRAEPAAVADLTRMCARLPLALRIAGARLAARPHWPVSRLVGRMRDERRRLDELAAGDLEVRASLAVTYNALSPHAQRAFRMLGILDSPDFAGWTTAALTATDPGTAEELVEELVDARLVEVVATGTAGTRYRMHDLVQLYARERAEECSPTEHTAAVSRVLAAALHLVERHMERLPLAVPRLYRPASPASPAAESTDHCRESESWFHAKEASLVAAIERGAALGVDELACALADALVFASFGIRNNFAGWNRAHSAALAAARTAGNDRAEAAIECGLGQLRYKEDRFVAARAHFETALTLFRRVGHRRGEAAARNGMGTVCRELGDHRTAIPLLEQALSLLEQLDDREGMAHAHYSIGYARRELGDDELAIHHLEAAAALYRAADHRRGEAIAVRGIGLVHRARGELDLAAERCTRAHRMITELGDTHLMCYTAQAMAKIWIRQGEPGRARAPLQHSLRTCTDMHDRFGAALVRRTVGELHLSVDAIPEALKELRLTLTSWQHLAHDLGAARTGRDLGAAYVRAGDCAAAHDVWRSAAETFQRFGTREAAELPAWRLVWGCRCL